MKIYDNELIKLETYSLEKINPHSKKQIKFIKSLDDFYTKHFLWDISKNIDNNYGFSYIIKKGKSRIGYLWISDIFSNDHVSLACTIEYSNRGNGIGTSVLKETTERLFEEDYIYQVDLDIENNNMASIKSAEKAGFIPTQIYMGKKIYSKKKV